jgi:uncharacterized protein (DUF1810 family)
MNDPYRLQRFVDAQQAVYDTVRAELRAGLKRSHWIWFIFPQIAGLGHSAMAHAFAISSLDEARAYLQHPLLGPRLRECSALLAAIDGRPIAAILGHPDDAKFRSSMTLFAHASDDNGVFLDCLQKYFSGHMDPLTLARL